MNTPRPEDEWWVADWLCEAVYAANTGRAAWVRWVNGGPGWRLTESPDEPPKGGGRWRKAAWVDWKTAAIFLGRTPGYDRPQWLVRSQVVATIREALDAEKRAA